LTRSHQRRWEELALDQYRTTQFQAVAVEEHSEKSTEMIRTAATSAFTHSGCGAHDLGDHPWSAR
jgi:hypothetical protein